MSNTFRLTEGGLELESTYWALEYDASDDTWHLGTDQAQGAYWHWAAFDCLADALKEVPNV